MYQCGSTASQRIQGTRPDQRLKYTLAETIGITALAKISKTFEWSVRFTIRHQRIHHALPHSLDRTKPVSDGALARYGKHIGREIYIR